MLISRFLSFGCLYYHYIKRKKKRLHILNFMVKKINIKFSNRFSFFIFLINFNFQKSIFPCPKRTYLKYFIKHYFAVCKYSSSFSTALDCLEITTFCSHALDFHLLSIIIPLIHSSEAKAIHTPTRPKLIFIPNT